MSVAAPGQVILFQVHNRQFWYEKDKKGPLEKLQ